MLLRHSEYVTRHIGLGRETTETAHEPKRPRPKRPINFRYDQNGPQLRPKRPTPKSKTAHDPSAVEGLKKWDGGRSSRWMSLWKGLNPSPVLGVRVCYPREIFEKVEICAVWCILAASGHQKWDGK